MLKRQRQNAMASANANANTQCSVCGKDTFLYRCIECTKAYVRMSRAFAKVAPEVKAGLQGMLREGKLDKV